jgi:hypothetical protein
MSNEQIVAAGKIADHLHDAAIELATTPAANRINWNAIFKILIQIAPLILPLLLTPDEQPTEK